MTINYNIFKDIYNEIQNNELLKIHNNDFLHFDQYYRDPIRLLIMGEFSAGKSTIINALLERDLAAIGAIATTALPTYFRYSEEEYSEIVYKDGRAVRQRFDIIKNLNSERQGQLKQLREQLDHINVYLDHPILKNIVLIDSPGLNSSNDIHTVNTLETLNHVDDAMWIFQYQHVGRNSEFEQLNQLKKAHLHPIGVVNMIDNAEDDDLSSYLNYELKKLEGRIRSILGISALEAKEARKEQDAELLELSGFPKFVETIEEIKQQTERKEAHFKRRLSPFWKEFQEAYAAVLSSAYYKEKLVEIETFKKGFQLEFDQIKSKNDKAIEQQKAHLQNYQQFVQIQRDQNFIEWFKSAEGTYALNENLYEKFKGPVQEILNLENQLNQYNEDVKIFNQAILYKTPGIGEIFKRLSYGQGDFYKYREQKKALHDRQKNLKKLFKHAKKQRKPILKLIDTNLNEIEQSMSMGAYRRQAEINQSIEEQKKLLDVIRDNRQLLERVHFELLFLITIRSYMKQAELQVNNRVLPKITLQHEALIETINADLDAQLEILDFTPLDENYDFKITGKFVIPEPSLEFEKINFMILRSYRPLAIVVTLILVLIASLTYAMLPQNWNNKSQPIIERVEQELLSEEPVEVNVPQELPFLVPQTDDGTSIGALLIVMEDFVFDNIEAPTEPLYRIAEQTTWPVYEQVDEWYRIQNNLWVHQSIGTFEKHLIVENEIGNLKNPIAYVTLNLENVAVYKNFFTDSIYFNLENGHYPVYEYFVNKRIRIGKDAWVSYDQAFDLDQPAIDWNQNFNEPLLGKGTNNAIPVPIYNDQKKVVGLLTERRQFDIFEQNSEAIRVSPSLWLKKSSEIDIELFDSNISFEEPTTSNLFSVSNYYVFIHGNYVQTYPVPSLDSQANGQLSKGELYMAQEVSIDNNWIKIGPEEWIYGNYQVALFPKSNGQIAWATVQVRNLNGRVAPNMEADVEMQFQPDTELRVFEISEDLQWIKIESNLWVKFDSEFLLFEPI